MFIWTMPTHLPVNKFFRTTNRSVLLLLSLPVVVVKICSKEKSCGVLCLHKDSGMFVLLLRPLCRSLSQQQFDDPEKPQSKDVVAASS